MKMLFVALVALVVLLWWPPEAPMRGQFGSSIVPLSISQGNAVPSRSRYITVPVAENSLRRSVTATGVLNANVNVEVGSQLSGQIAELLVDFNDTVTKGQPLARLDERTFEARLAEARAEREVAEAAINVARAKLERAQIEVVNTEAERTVLQARTDNARLKLLGAKNELKRKEALRERQASAAVEVEGAQMKVGSAEAALREAEAIASAQENKIAGAKADLRRAEAELQTAIATLPQKEAQLQVAVIDLDRATIRSPIDGVVVGRKVNEGQTLATTLEAKTLFIIAGNLRQMEIDAKVDEADIGKIQIGQEAE